MEEKETNLEKVITWCYSKSVYEWTLDEKNERVGLPMTKNENGAVSSSQAYQSLREAVYAFLKEAGWTEDNEVQYLETKNANGEPITCIAVNIKHDGAETESVATFSKVVMTVHTEIESCSLNDIKAAVSD